MKLQIELMVFHQKILPFPSVNILLSIAPDGHIYALSPSNPGRIVDSTIMGRVWKEWTEGWFTNEFMLGDAGFGGINQNLLVPDDYVAPYDHELHKYRVKVENVISWCNSFIMLCAFEE
jgi:hypothetical protein